MGQKVGHRTRRAEDSGEQEKVERQARVRQLGRVLAACSDVQGKHVCSPVPRPTSVEAQGWGS